MQLGYFWSTQGETQHINAEYTRGNDYTVNGHQSSNGFFGLGYYVDALDKDRFALSYGLNGFFLPKTGVGGDIIQESTFTNLNYWYSIQHIPVYLAAKAILKNNNPKYNITLDGGLGPNFMRTSAYNETALNDYTIPANNFSPHNSVTFSATASIGVRLNNVFGKAPLECNYRFFYLGPGQLSINNDLLLNTLKTGNNFANAVICSLTV